jgi:hypothetical protein
MRANLPLIASLAHLVCASPHQHPVSKSCKDYTFNLKVTSENLKWNYKLINDNYDMTEFNTDIGRRDAADVFQPFSPSTGPETATYRISGTYCEPKKKGNGVVLTLTHGGGFDK